MGETAPTRTVSLTVSLFDDARKSKFQSELPLNPLNSVDRGIRIEINGVSSFLAYTWASRGDSQEALFSSTESFPSINPASPGNRTGRYSP